MLNPHIRGSERDHHIEHPQLILGEFLDTVIDRCFVCQGAKEIYVFESKIPISPTFVVYKVTGELKSIKDFTHVLF